MQEFVELSSCYTLRTDPSTWLTIQVNFLGANFCSIKKLKESCITDEASLAYSRLDAPRPSSSRRSLWSFNKPKTITIPASKSRRKKTKRDLELEREWLLLGEPQSPLPRVTVLDSPEQESCILNEPAVSDVDCIDREILTETDSSTDIDAIVDEYRQKVKVNCFISRIYFRL